MLERFKVPQKDIVRVTEASLRETVTAVFTKMGVSQEDSIEGANTLVMSDLRGVESHGVSNMLRTYVQYYKEHKINPKPNWHVVRESPGTAVIDADRGLAIMLGPKAMQIAIKKATSVGVGIVTMNNAGHSGAIGHHAMLAATNDMVGMCATAAGSMVAPTFASQGRLGTNPISISAPARNEPPLLFDAATSAIAGNKIPLANRVGATLLPGWISDQSGTPIMEETPPKQRGLYHHLPLGGNKEGGSHKGYGFALMSEILSTMLSGFLPTMLTGYPSISSGCHYFAAYNIEAFTDLEEFKDNMDRMLKMLRETKAAPGHKRVLYPGLSEYEDEKDRRDNGIPLHREVIQWFSDITNDLNIPRLHTIPPTAK